MYRVDTHAAIQRITDAGVAPAAAQAIVGEMVRADENRVYAEFRQLRDEIGILRREMQDLQSRLATFREPAKAALRAVQP